MVAGGPWTFLWTGKLQSLKEAALGSRVSQNVDQKWNLGSKMCSDISRRTQIAKYAEGTKLQGRLTENALEMTCHAPKNFGDSITADHNVLNEECESRNSHRYAVLVQDLATTLEIWATQRTANTHLLARDGSSSHPGHGHQAPAWGPSSCAWRLSCAWPVFPWRVVVLVSRPVSSGCLALSAHPPRLPMLAHHSGAPGAWPSTLLQSPRRHLAALPGLLHPQPRPPRLPALQRLRPTPMMTGTLSSMHMASPRLPVALRPPSPSRPTPLELVGALATSAAAVCARPPSALCGGRSDVLSPVLCALSAGVASSCGFVCFSVGAGLLFRWRREADFGGLLRFLPPVLCGARLSLRVGSVLWGMSTAPLVFDVLLGDATLAYTCGAPCLARDCPGGFCPLSRGSCPLTPLLCEPSRASDLTLRASLAWAFVARFPRSRGVGLHV